MNHIRVAHSESGCWEVQRDGCVLDVKPPHMWRDAYIEARREAVYQNLNIISLEICS